MDTVNKISESFFLLKKRIREQDIKDLISSSNRSLVTVIKNLNAKPKENTEKKNKDKFLLAPAPSQKYSLSENKFSNLLETKIKKIKDKNDKNDKKPGQTQKKKVNNNSNTMLPQPGILPPDNLLNLAFNKNTLSKIQSANLSSKNDSNNRNNLNNNNKDNIYNDDTEMLSPEIINDDNTINSPEIKNDFEKSPDNGKESEDPFDLNDDEDELLNKKGDIFDDNMLGEQSDLEIASPEVKPFEKNSPVDNTTNNTVGNIDKIINKDNINEKKDEEKKENNENIIVNNTKISIPIYFFGETQEEGDKIKNITEKKQPNNNINKLNNTISSTGTTKIQSNSNKIQNHHSSNPSSEPKIKPKSTITNSNKDQSLSRKQNNIKSPTTQPKTQSQKSNKQELQNSITVKPSSPTLPKQKPSSTQKPPNQHIGPIKPRPLTSSTTKEPDYGIKKKEYDLVCLSMLDNLTSKIKNKYQPSPNSSVLKEFNEIQKLLQITSETSTDKSKRVHQITEKCIKIIGILCNIFEDEKKRELYLNEINQVLEVVGTFYHRVKIDFTNSIPTWFKMYKKTLKFVYSLFSIKKYSQNQLKEILHMTSNETKMKNLIKFTKVYKSYMNSVEKLKEYFTKKIGGTEDKKRKKILESLVLYMETEPNAIKYGKCFKVSKKVIDLIIEYSNNNEII